jgi:hypothetical protein
VTITRRRVWLVLGVGLVLWGLMTHGTYAGTGDDPHYKAIAHSIAFDRDLDVTDEYALEGERIVGGRLEPELHARPGRDGRLRPVHDVGWPLLASPWYRASSALADLADRAIPPAILARVRLNRALVLRHLLSFLTIALTAWLAVLLMSVFDGLGGGARPAWWAALLVLSPPILSHAYLFFTEIVSAVLVLWTLIRIRQAGARPWAWWLAGFVTGYLLLVHVRNVGLVAGLTAVALYHLSGRPDTRRLMFWFAGGLVPPVVARTLLTWHFWGAWLFTPHVRPGPSGDGAAGEFGIRLAGLLIDQEHGLLLTAPVFLLVPAGVWLLWRRDRSLAAPLLGLTGAYVLTIALPGLNPHGWRGGWSPAARFLVPIAPLLAVFVYAVASRAGRLSRVVWIVVGLQASISAYLWQHPKLTWDDGDGASALLTAIDGGTGLLSSSVPALAAPLTPRMWVVIAAGLVLWAAMTCWLCRGVSPAGAGALPTNRRHATGGGE